MWMLEDYNLTNRQVTKTVGTTNSTTETFLNGCLPDFILVVAMNMAETAKPTYKTLFTYLWLEIWSNSFSSSVELVSPTGPQTDPRTSWGRSESICDRVWTNVMAQEEKINDPQTHLALSPVDHECLYWNLCQSIQWLWHAPVWTKVADWQWKKTLVLMSFIRLIEP